MKQNLTFVLLRGLFLFIFILFFPVKIQYVVAFDVKELIVNDSAVDKAADVQPTAEKVLKNQLIPEELKDKKILFIARQQFVQDHHNTATMFQNNKVNTNHFVGGSAMKTVDFSNGGKVEVLLDVPEGIVRDPEISYDGQRVLFSLRKNKADDYHIYEMNLSDKSIRQITFGTDLSDIDPAYLPDGRIVFSSTREPKYCMCNRHIMCNLYVVNSDGSDMLQIGHSTLFEGHSTVLSDGRIIYDRWEYVDRFFGDAQGLWTTNPDGTVNALFYGNNTGSPGSFLDPREIPDTKLVVCTMSGSHYRPWGGIAVIDRTKGIEGQDGIVRTWPPEVFDKIQIVGNRDSIVLIPIRYEDPFPLDEEHVICTRQLIKDNEKTGLFLLTADESDRLIYSEPEDSKFGCFDPVIICSRPLPAVILNRTDLTKKTGTLYVSNVYIGTGMETVEPGSAKWLRIIESPEKRFWTHSSWSGGTGEQAPGMSYDDYNNKRILGTVPIEADGSAFFEIPSDTFVYFQILDQQGRMIQSMRSGTIVRPGENQGCIGCHEDRLNAVPLAKKPLAMNRKPDQMNGWYGSARNFSYRQEVQPVFDKHCLQCHDKGKPGAKSICLAPDRNMVFNNAYYELRKNKKLVNAIGAGPAPIQNPRSWGSFVSPLAKVVLKGHGDPERDSKFVLSSEEKDRIITWIDLNGPYYAEYSSPYINNFTGRCPLDTNQLNRLSALTGIKLQDWKNVNLVWFDRPELSPCLDEMDKNSPEYKEAVEIIVAGKTVLDTIPRPDTECWKLCPEDQKMQNIYDQFLQNEQESIKKAAQKQQLVLP